MTDEPPQDVSTIVPFFDIEAAYLGAVPFGTGHINDTFIGTYRQGDAELRYVHQRINHHVFRQPVALMENVGRVTAHLQHKLGAGAGGNSERQALALVLARDGRPYHRDDDGYYWRTYHYIDNTRSFEAVERPAQAYEAARAFGDFQQLLVDLPEPRLLETIPNFHHTPSRFEAFTRALAADPLNRAQQARAEIEFALRREPITAILIAQQEAGLIPERTTHNDTKLNNVLMSTDTGKAVCVVDLDTVMPGLVLYDFGDMVRTATSPAAEDERDLSKVQMQMPMFRALVDGYLSEAAGFLTPAEKAHLAFSGKLITFEIGLRFLTDHLLGDEYFRIHRENHNLDRCRTQFALVESIEAQEEAMEECVAQWRGTGEPPEATRL